MARFTILEHDYPFVHWDLLLETPADRIPAWRLLTEPAAGEASSSSDWHTMEQKSQANRDHMTIFAQLLPDHRRLYLDYEGLVSGGRGCVSQWDTGYYQTLFQSEHNWEMRLEGSRLRGFAVLQRLNEPNENDADWKFVFLSDENE